MKEGIIINTQVTAALAVGRMQEMATVKDFLMVQKEGLDGEFEKAIKKLPTDKAKKS